MEPIIVQTTIKASKEKVWQFWTEPDHIMQWNNASDDWHTTAATNDVKVGGKLFSRMEAKDGSFGFDLEGIYLDVEKFKKLVYGFEDGRKIIVEFTESEDGVTVTQSFDPENENPREMQEQGWQAILNNFKKHVLEN